MSESELVAKTRLSLSKGDVRLLRNNVGTLRDRNGTYVHYGLCTGSSDLVGFQSIAITADMIGKRVAVFVALEAKAPNGKPTTEQLAFVTMVKRAGGIAGIFKSVDEAREILHGS